MALFRIRNTNGFTTTTTVGFTGSHTEVRPNPGKLRVAAGLPPAHTLSPRVDNFQQAGLRVTQAKEFIDRCGADVVHHPGPLNARTHGRGRQFLSSIANTVGKVVGVGRGSAPQVETAFARPDRPVKLNTGTSRLHRALFESRHDAGLRRQLEANVSEKKTALMAESKVGLRTAIDRETALSNKAAQLDGVQQIMRDAIANAQTTHRDLVSYNSRVVNAYDAVTRSVAHQSARVSVLTNAQAVMRTQANELNSAILSNRQMHQALSEQAEVLDVLLQELPAPPAQRPPLSPLPRAQLLTLRERAARNLERTEERVARLELAVRRAQVNLNARLQQMRAAPPDSAQRMQLRDEACACRDARDRATELLTQGQTMARGFAQQVRRCETSITRLDEHAQHRQYDQLRSERTLLGHKLNDLELEHQDLVARSQPLRANLRANRQELNEARAVHEQLKDSQFKTKLEVDRSETAWRVSLQELEQLQVENERLEPMADKLSVSHTEALNEASVLRAQEEIRLESKLQEMVKAPPGFEPGQVTPELRARMAELAQRLRGVPEGLSPGAATTLRRDRLPTDQTLEIISHSLALATRGNGVEAQRALTSLMNRPFADLVPLPDRNFNGDEIKPGTELDDNSAQKRTASLLAECPSGGELLQRLVQPGPVPSRQMQDAVAVYFRATNALPDTSDVPSQRHLQFAEQAAKILAHPDAADAELSRLQRVSFNAVRNGFTSTADGSPYQIANAAIEKLADHWVTRGQSGANKTSPLHARQRESATKVAADLGFPTHEAKLNARLKDACDELQKLIAHELVVARTKVGLARERNHAEAVAGSPPAVPQDTGAAMAAPPEVPEALLLAQSMLQHIRARAEGGERIDTLRLDNRAWRAINKDTQRVQQREMKSTTPLDERTLGLRPQGAAPLDERLQALRRQATDADAPAQALGEQPDFDDLENDLWAMQFEKPTVLQALTTLRDRLTRSGTVNPSSGTSTPTGRPGPGAVSASNSAAPDPILTAAQAELDALEADLGPRPSATGIDLSQYLQQQASPDWTRPGASPNQTRPSAVSSPDPLGTDDDDLLPADVDADVDPRPRTRLDQALSDAAAHQAQIDCFKSSKGQFSPEALEQWMTPALVTPSGGADFGSVTFSQGRQRGLGTSGLFGIATQVATGLGLIVRPELDGVRGRRDQFRFVRDAYGVGMFMGRTREGSVSVGGSLAVARPLAGPNNLLTGGPVASLIHTWATSNLEGGAVIRVPKFDGKSGAEQSAELSQVLSTALTWREPVKEGGGQLYDSALEALLDRHAAVSVTTVDSARTFRHTANASLSGFLGLGGPVGRAGGFATLSGGVTSSNTQETRSSKHTGGTQSIQQQSKLVNHIQGVTTGMFGRLGYVNPGQPRLAGARANLLSVGASADLRLSSALAGSTLVRQPDGSIVGQRTIEYSSYKKFEAAVNLHREKWIQEGIRFANWPEALPLADKRILSERALDDFMAKAKASLEAGTVTLNETMDIKPEVAAQLNANLALEELARLGKRYDDALALKAARDEILAQDSSYQPFFLLPTARSSITGSTGVNVGVIATETHGANATRLYDYFPRMTTPAI